MVVHVAVHVLHEIAHGALGFHLPKHCDHGLVQEPGRVGDVVRGEQRTASEQLERVTT